jgi:hypothetical protein
VKLRRKAVAAGARGVDRQPGRLVDDQRLGIFEQHPRRRVDGSVARLAFRSPAVDRMWVDL